MTRFSVPVICFRNTVYKMLSDPWYDNQAKNETDETQKIFIKQLKSSGKTPSIFSDNFLKNPDTIPPFHATFLEDLLERVKETKRKCVAVENAILLIMKPKNWKCQ